MEPSVFLNKLSKKQDDIIRMYKSIRPSLDMDVIQDFYIHAYTNIEGDKVFTEEGFNYGYVKRSLFNFVIDKHRYNNSNKRVKINRNVEVVNIEQESDDVETLDRLIYEEDMSELDNIKSFFSTEEINLVTLLLSSKLSAYVKEEFISNTGKTDPKLIWNKYMKEYYRARKILKEMKQIKESKVTNN